VKPVTGRSRVGYEPRMNVQELVDHHALAAIERQMVFADILGDRRYAIDLETGTATIGDDLEVRVGLLGSAAPGPGTWLWGWANPGGYSPAVLATAERARAFGAEHEIPELADAEVPLDDGWDATRAGIAVVGATGLRAWLPVEAEGGTQVMLGIESDLPPAPPTVEPTRLGPVLNQALTSGLVGDWRRALTAYARHRGGGLRDEGDTLVLEPAGGDRGATVELDELGRITSLALTRSAERYDPSTGERPEAPRGGAPEPTDADGAGDEEPRRRGLFRRRR
jgi:hypothetical protein